MPTIPLSLILVPVGAGVAALVWRWENRAHLRSLPSIGLNSEDHESWTSRYDIRIYNNSEKPMTNVLVELVQHAEAHLHRHPDFPPRVALPFPSCPNGVLNPKSSASLTVFQQIEKGDRHFIGMPGKGAKKSTEPIPGFTYPFEVRVSCMEFNPASALIKVKIDDGGNSTTISIGEMK